MLVKRKNKITCLLFIKSMCLVVTLLCNVAAFAIEIVNNKSPMLEQAKTNGLLMAKVEILLVQNNQERVIPTRYELKNGDKIRFRVQSSLNSHYSLNALDAKGQKLESTLLNGQLTSSQALLVPSLDLGAFQLDNEPGIEWLQLIISSKVGQITVTKQKSLVSQKHPNGKINKIVFRNIKLRSAPENQIHYDEINHAIFFSRQHVAGTEQVISLSFGLEHGQ